MKNSNKRLKRDSIVTEKDYQRKIKKLEENLESVTCLVVQCLKKMDNQEIRITDLEQRHLVKDAYKNYGLQIERDQRNCEKVIRLVKLEED